MGDWFGGFDLAMHRVGEITLRARTGGRPGAPALLLLHGFPQTHVMWHRVARKLADRFFVVLPDLRGQDLVEAYRAADAFIFPSTTETFGLVALEAMACRLPVIAARTGGVLDTVEDGVNGLFFDSQQPQEMRRQVLRLRDDPVLRECLAANALQHARSRSWRGTMDQLVEYYFAARRVFRLCGAPLGPATS